MSVLNNSNCNECGLESNGNEYCHLCAPYVHTNQGVSMKNVLDVREEQRSELIKQLYGVIEYDDMFDDKRNINTIAFNATQGGQDANDYLTRSEMEELSKQDKDYECVPNDFMDYDTKPSRRVLSKITALPVDHELRQAYYNGDYDIAPSGETMEFKPVFISREQQAINLAYYTHRVVSVTNIKGLSAIAKMIYTAQKRDGGMYFFPKGGSAQFWKTYKDVKIEYIEPILNELDELISEASTIQRLKGIKQAIYKQKIDFTEKRVLWDACDMKINQLSA